MKISQLKNLGPKSETQLADIGIGSAEALADMGAVEAYVRLKIQAQAHISANFLYAMEAALRDSHWREISHEDKLILQANVAALQDLITFQSPDA